MLDPTLFAWNDWYMNFLLRNKRRLERKAPNMAMKTIRVRVHAGHLEPLDALSLPEGTEVDVHFETPTVGSPSTILSAMRALPLLDPAGVDELERVIEAGKLPVRSESVFDHPKA